MGVPAAFRWLSKKYPKIVSRVIEDSPKDVNGVTIPVDITTPNPNNVEFDNLYLDFNGIVHPCSHPEDRPPPENEEEMMLEIFKYTERVVNMVRPRKLLLIAVDGVAPRAKMNQQRSRRFRSAQDSAIKVAATERIIDELKAQGRQVDDSLKPKRDWDSNAITPGTEFMDILAASIRYWVVYKLNTDPGWANLNCIVSDAGVPGEGEHKIMEFIRSQRANPAHDPNTRHVMYGLDADLIMLGLATREIHFTVLREDVFFQEGNGRGCRICGQEGHFAADCTGKPKEKSGEFDEKAAAKPPKPFIWLHVETLREYLEAELFVPGMVFSFDLERAIDDWVFMFFFVGNDFLPHLPSLDIRENAIDTLISIWKACLGKMGGYVTCDGSVNLARAEIILEALGEKEDTIFRRRHQQAERQKERDAERKRQREGAVGNQVPENLPRLSQAPTSVPPPTTTPSSKRRKSSNIPPPPVPDLMAPSAIQGNVNIVPGVQGPAGKAISQTNKDIVANRKALRMGGNPLPQSIAVNENKSAAEALRAELGLAGPKTGGPTTPISAKAALKRKSAVLEEENEDTDYSSPATPIPVAQRAVNGVVEDAPDPVRLWEPGQKERYYEHKFHKDYHKDVAFRRQLVKHYVEGFCWVLLYYYQGCPSWTWYYPYHFAPFASDFEQISDLEISFEKGIPFRSAQQLMGVLPAASKTLIAKPFRRLMTDDNSPIVDFYPEDFEIDMNGKKMLWQGVALLPFIDEDRLLEAMKPLYGELSEEEARRNEMGYEVLFVGQQNTLYDILGETFYAMKDGVEIIHLNPGASKRLIGAVAKDENCIPHGSYAYPFASSSIYPSIDHDITLSVKFLMQKSPHVHKSMLLRGAVADDQKLNDMDFEVMRRHAATHDRINGFTWQSRDSRGNGSSYSNRSNGYSQGSGSQPMISYPPAVPTPGVPPSNAAASAWYQQTSATFSNSGAGIINQRSGVMRLDDLSAMFSDNNNQRGGPRRGDRDRGYYGNRGSSGGSGYYQGYDNRYGGSGSGYHRDR